VFESFGKAQLIALESDGFAALSENVSEWILVFYKHWIHFGLQELVRGISSLLIPYRSIASFAVG
jgi:hypothetical protein